MLVLAENRKRPRREHTGLSGGFAAARTGSFFAARPPQKAPETGGFASLVLDLQEAVDALPPVEAEIVLDRVKGYTYREIAARRRVSQKRIAAVLAALEERIV